jgi:hypothetical protein
MASITDLPRELRQKIFLAAIWQENLVGTAWPKSIIALLHVSRLIRHDMPWVIKSWCPLWCLQRPNEATQFRPLVVGGTECRPTLNCLCIDVFHDVLLDNLKRADWATGEPQVLRHELVEHWYQGVSQLPSSGVDTVLLDVTPVPGWMRERNTKTTPKTLEGSTMATSAGSTGWKYQLTALLCDSRTSRIFLPAHIDGVSRLVTRIFQHFERNITLRLTGTLSHKNRQFIAAVTDRCTSLGIAIQYDGQYVNKHQALRQTVERIAPKNKPPGISAQDWHSALKLAPLRRIAWTKNSINVCDQISERSGTETVQEVVQNLGLFLTSTDATVLKMPPSDNMHRVLIHSVAQDMGLTTQSEGYNEGRHVIVYKRR